MRSPDQEAALTAIRLVAGHLEALAGHRWVRDVDQGAIASAELLPLLDHAETTLVGLDRQRSAAACLSRCAIRDCGAVLLDDLAHLQDAQTREAVVQALERIAYQPAAPVVLAMMEKATPAFRQSGYAKVLATLRYAPAVPVLERLCVNAHPSADTLAFDRNWLGGERLELSLLRLTAPWGEPAAGVRLLLLPYARTDAGKDSRIAVLIENLGGVEVTAIPFMQGGGNSGFVIDGVDHPDPAAPFEGCFTIRQHGTWIDVCTLERTGIAPGRHRVGYHAGGAVANEVVIDIAAAP